MPSSVRFGQTNRAIYSSIKAAHGCKKSSPSYQLNSLNFDFKKYPWDPPGTTLKGYPKERERVPQTFQIFRQNLWFSDLQDFIHRWPGYQSIFPLGMIIFDIHSLTSPQWFLQSFMATLKSFHRGTKHEFHYFADPDVTRQKWWKRHWRIKCNCPFPFSLWKCEVIFRRVNP